MLLKQSKFDEDKQIKCKIFKRVFLLIDRPHALMFLFIQAIDFQ